MTDHLDANSLTRMATDYLARYAAPTRRLRLVLERRIRRWHAKRELPVPDDAGRLIDEVVAKLTGSGVIDDDAFAISKARSLVRKGLPERRIRSTLDAAGLDARHDGLDTVLGVDDADQAHRYAARKRLGPCRSKDRPRYREKDIRSLMRAGFSHRVATAAIDAEPDT